MTRVIDIEIKKKIFFFSNRLFIEKGVDVVQDLHSYPILDGYATASVGLSWRRMV
jgi:hypothetical protein